MNLIHSKTVHSSENIFWEDFPMKWKELPSKPVLVLSLPFPPGGMEEDTLKKMLGGCALTHEKYNVLHLEPGEKVAWHRLRDHFAPSQVIMLGIDPAQLSIAALFRFNEPNRFNDCTFIPSLSLQQLDKHPEAKKGLWLQALKPTFT